MESLTLHDWPCRAPDTPPTPTALHHTRDQPHKTPESNRAGQDSNVLDNILGKDHGAPVTQLEEKMAQIEEKAEEAGKHNTDGTVLIEQTGEKPPTPKGGAAALMEELLMDEHLIPIEEIYERLSNDPSMGLHPDEVKRRRAQGGYNEITPLKMEWPRRRCQTKIVESWQYMSQGAAYLDASVMRIGTPMGACTSGRWLVYGDIIKIRGGDRIPADVRVIEASDDFCVYQVCLTGEPDALNRKKPLRAGEAQENPLDALNLCLYGMRCPAGTAKGIVIKIGDERVMVRHWDSQLQEELKAAAAQHCGTCLLI